MNLQVNTINKTTFHNNFAKIFLQFEPITEDLTQLLQACYNPITSDIELENRTKILDELFGYAKTTYELTYNPYDEATGIFHKFLDEYPNSVSEYIDEVFSTSSRFFFTDIENRDISDY